MEKIKDNQPSSKQEVMITEAPKGRGITHAEYLLFSEMAYSDYAIPQDESLEISKAYKKRMDDREEEAKNEKPEKKQEAALALLESDKEFYDPVVAGLSDWNVVKSQGNTKSGFAGTAFESADGQMVIAFRGTEPKTDFLRDYAHANIPGGFLLDTAS